MKKIRLFFTLFLISRVFYASENILSDRHRDKHRIAKEKYVEISNKLHDFEKDFSQEQSRLSDNDREQLAFMRMQVAGIQQCASQTDFFINFNPHLDDQLLEAIKGCIIVYEEHVKKFAIKFHNTRSFFEEKLLELAK